ncbi:expressed unknown protein [Seminavis robusta]|uniref:DUF6824 domain-containing protein n=1 Tax=Seminavis robusta TaxID=568900 RepID=A0A9N8DGU8_9STRA|nr:expressed unknown protein [Seminavis robusta]|eukprot:Sro60_g034820.1 n/a (1490) ;mRNA; r:113408-118209
MSYDKSLVALKSDYVPGPFSVICQRGKMAYTHNQHFRNLLKGHVDKYKTAASRQLKSMVVSDIVDKVRAKSPEGAFVRCVHGVWYECGEDIAREKVGGCFRELLADHYESSTKSKKRRRDAEKAAQDAAQEENLKSLVHPEITKSITPEVITPTDKDILFKPGGRVAGTAGSIYAKLVETTYQDYQRDPSMRGTFVQIVIEGLKKNGGRFLEQKSEGVVLADKETVSTQINQAFQRRIRQQHDRENKVAQIAQKKATAVFQDHIATNVKYTHSAKGTAPVTVHVTVPAATNDTQAAAVAAANQPTAATKATKSIPAYPAAAHLQTQLAPLKHKPPPAVTNAAAPSRPSKTYPSTAPVPVPPKPHVAPPYPHPNSIPPAPYVAGFPQGMPMNNAVGTSLCATANIQQGRPTSPNIGRGRPMNGNFGPGAPNGHQRTNAAPAPASVLAHASNRAPETAAKANAEATANQEGPASFISPSPNNPNDPMVQIPMSVALEALQAIKSRALKKNKRRRAAFADSNDTSQPAIDGLVEQMRSRINEVQHNPSSERPDVICLDDDDDFDEVKHVDNPTIVPPQNHQSHLKAPPHASPSQGRRTSVLQSRPDGGATNQEPNAKNQGGNAGNAAGSSHATAPQNQLKAPPRTSPNTYPQNQNQWKSPPRTSPNTYPQNQNHLKAPPQTSPNTYPQNQNGVLKQSPEVRQKGTRANTCAASPNASIDGRKDGREDGASAAKNHSQHVQTTNAQQNQQDREVAEQALDALRTLFPSSANKKQKQKPGHDRSSVGRPSRVYRLALEKIMTYTLTAKNPGSNAPHTEPSGAESDNTRKRPTTGVPQMTHPADNLLSHTHTEAAGLANAQLKMPAKATENHGAITNSNIDLNNEVSSHHHARRYPVNRSQSDDGAIMAGRQSRRASSTINTDVNSSSHDPQNHSVENTKRPREALVDPEAAKVSGRDYLIHRLKKQRRNTAEPAGLTSAEDRIKVLLKRQNEVLQRQLETGQQLLKQQSRQGSSAGMHQNQMLTAQQIEYQVQQLKIQQEMAKAIQEAERLLSQRKQMAEQRLLQEFPQDQHHHPEQPELLPRRREREPTEQQEETALERFRRSYFGSGSESKECRTVPDLLHRSPAPSRRSPAVRSFQESDELRELERLEQNREDLQLEQTNAVQVQEYVESFPPMEKSPPPPRQEAESRVYFHPSEASSPPQEAAASQAHSDNKQSPDYSVHTSTEAKENSEHHGEQTTRASSDLREVGVQDLSMPVETEGYVTAPTLDAVTSTPFIPTIDHTEDEQRPKAPEPPGEKVVDPMVYLEEADGCNDKDEFALKNVDDVDDGASRQVMEPEACASFEKMQCNVELAEAVEANPETAVVNHEPSDPRTAGQLGDEMKPSALNHEAARPPEEVEIDVTGVRCDELDASEKVDQVSEKEDGAKSMEHDVHPSQGEDSPYHGSGEEAENTHAEQSLEATSHSQEMYAEMEGADAGGYASDGEESAYVVV